MYYVTTGFTPEYKKLILNEITDNSDNFSTAHLILNIFEEELVDND